MPYDLPIIYCCIKPTRMSTTLKFHNITKCIRADAFSTDELLALFHSVYNSSRYDPDEPHYVYFGNDAARLTFKSNSRKILVIEVADPLSTEFKTLEIHIANALDASQEKAVSARFVFQNGEFNLLFRWGDEFQIFRAPQGAPVPDELSGQFPGVIQYHYLRSGIVWLDAVRQNKASRRNFLRLVPIVAQTTGRHLFDPFLQADTRKSWSFSVEDSRLTSRWVQLGYTLSDFDNSQFHEDAYGIRCPDINDDNGMRLSRHNEIRKLLMAFENCDEDSQDIFLAGAEWYHSALTARTKTEAYLALSIMIETLLPEEAGQCDQCGQATYAISKKFQDFIVCHVGGLNDESDNDLRQLAKGLYSLRSSIAHNGRWLADEHIGFSLGFVPRGVKEKDLLQRLYKIGAAVLCSWLESKRQTQYHSDCSLGLGVTKSDD